MVPFNADHMTRTGSMVLQVRKKPVIVHAIKMGMPEGFEVTTKEGKTWRCEGPIGASVAVDTDGDAGVMTVTVTE